MNIIDAMRVLSNVWDADIEDVFGAESIFVNLIAQFNALAPTPEMWAEYPWADWYTIDFNRSYYCAFWQYEPVIGSYPFWNHQFQIGNLKYPSCESIVVPIGIDWRLLKFERPGVTG